MKAAGPIKASGFSNRTIILICLTVRNPKRYNTIFNHQNKKDPQIFYQEQYTKSALTLRLD